MSSEPSIDGADVPQTPDLDKVRRVVEAVAKARDGAPSAEEISASTRIQSRHVAYALRAARTLGLVGPHHKITELGRTLVGSAAGSEGERAVLRKAIEESAVIRAIAPDLLAPVGPSSDELASRIGRLAGLAPSTAAHRAGDLLAWRAQLLQQRLLC